LLGGNQLLVSKNFLEIMLDGITQKLWAEAVHRCRKGEQWFLENKEVIKTASEEQEDRYVADPWESLIAGWLLDQTEVTTADVLLQALHKDAGLWGRPDEMRIGAILGRLHWTSKKPHKGRRIYRREETSL
jgi:putative DNA primase/helicase